MAEEEVGAQASRRAFLATAAATAVAADLHAAQAAAESDREYWVHLLTRIADPVLSALAEHKLAATMPVEAPHGNAEERRQFTYLEALGRLLCGMSAWLESGESSGREGELRQHYAELARRSLAAAVDPDSPDFMNFTRGAQPLVDAAFLALGLLRAPNELWLKLDAPTRANLVKALRSSRVILPPFNNWLLFSATIEACFARFGESWDSMRVDYAVRQHDQWYKGDGVYSDGPQLHCDYYNSYVMQPMLVEVLATVSKLSKAWDSFYPVILTRSRRYAAIQERLIAPDGSFPALGRSITYRFGAFHLLASMALRHELPDGLAPEQVRSGLTAVMRRMIEAPGTFHEKGWLNVGFYGHQPAQAEPYISTGSLYLCSTALLPLGLPDTDPFWKNPAQPWTAKKIWSGVNVPADHSI